ncbi:MAG: penicillin-binding protein 2, partial [Brevundimonas sp.]|nr:penicillin-binding protein 2 [Brevundimonas sp.]
MSVHDHRHFRPAPGAPITSTVAPWLRWVGSLVWWVEHAFERARADARPEEDTRVRIFLVMAVFSLVFVGLALGAAHAALLTPKGRVGLGGNPDARVRADLVDRTGVLLASNITHYGLYVNPAEIWDRQQAARVLRRTLPRISARRLNAVLFGQRRGMVAQSLTPAERSAVHALALGGVSFEPEDRRIYPMGQSARFVIGQSDSGGMGISGAEQAFNQEIRDAGAVSRDF